MAYKHWCGIVQKVLAPSVSEDRCPLWAAALVGGWRDQQWYGTSGDVILRNSFRCGQERSALVAYPSGILDCICNGGFRPFSRFASGHLPYSVDLHRPALCLPLRISLRNLVYEVISTSDGCLIFLEGTRRRRGCAEAGG